MPSIAPTSRTRRPRRRRPRTYDLADWIAITVTLAAFVGLLCWMTAVATS